MTSALFALNQQPLFLGKHGYLFDGRPIPRVTEILQVFDKSFRLPWALKEMEKYVNENWMPDKLYTTEAKERIVHDGKSAFDNISFKAMARGTRVHKWIQDHINRIDPPMPEDPKIAGPIHQFLKWEESSGVKWLASELIIASIAHWYAGTIDFIAIIDDKLVLGDFKVSSKISTGYFLQTMAYLIALEELIKESFYNLTPNNLMTLGPAEKMTMDEVESLHVLINFSALEQPPEIHHRLIVQIPPDNSPVNALVVPTDPNRDREAFLHAYGMYQWTQHCKSRYKVS